MISVEGSTEENLNTLFDKIEKTLDKVQSIGQLSNQDEKILSTLFDDTSYYVM